MFLVRKGRAFYATLYQYVLFSIEGGGRLLKHGGLGILDHRFSEESMHNTSKATSGELVENLLGGTALNYVGRRACVRPASTDARKERKYAEMAELARQK